MGVWTCQPTAWRQCRAYSVSILQHSTICKFNASPEQPALVFFALGGNEHSTVGRMNTAQFQLKIKKQQSELSPCVVHQPAGHISIASPRRLSLNTSEHEKKKTKKNTVPAEHVRACGRPHGFGQTCGPRPPTSTCPPRTAAPKPHTTHPCPRRAACPRRRHSRGAPAAASCRTQGDVTDRPSVHWQPQQRRPDTDAVLSRGGREKGRATRRSGCSIRMCLASEYDAVVSGSHDGHDHWQYY